MKSAKSVRGNCSFTTLQTFSVFVDFYIVTIHTEFTHDNVPESEKPKLDSALREYRDWLLNELDINWSHDDKKRESLISTIQTLWGQIQNILIDYDKQGTDVDWVSTSDEVKKSISDLMPLVRPHISLTGLSAISQKHGLLLLISKILGIAKPLLLAEFTKCLRDNGLDFFADKLNKVTV